MKIVRIAVSVWNDFRASTAHRGSSYTLIFAFLVLSGCATLVPQRTPAPLLTWVHVPQALPEGISAYEADDPTLPLRAWLVRIDPSRHPVRVVSSEDPSDWRETASQFGARTDACAILNGGYFRMGNFPASAVGLLVERGIQTAPPTTEESRNDVPYRVARAAFGLSQKGTVEVGWADVDEAGNLVLRSAPWPNRRGHPAPPDAPPPATLWNPQEAMAAGPMLLYNGRLRVTDEAEVFFGSSIPAVHPRTAVGVTASGEMLWLVVDGRQAQSRGSSLPELGRILLEAGAIHALNLDGGGSSTLVVQDSLLNRPTGGFFQREIHNALVAGSCRD